MPRISATAPATKITSTAAAAGAKTRGAANKPQIADDDLFAKAAKRYAEAQEDLLKFFKAPTWKRTAVAFLSAIVVGCGIGWLAGELLSWLVVGAVALSVPTFLVMLTYFVGVVIACYYGGKLAGRIAGAVLTGEADERAIAAYDSVKSALGKLNPLNWRSAQVA